MGFVRASSVAIVFVVFGAAAHGGSTAGVVRPAAVARCTSAGNACVEWSRRIDGERVRHRTQIHAATAERAPGPSRPRAERLIVATRPGAELPTRPVARSVRMLPRTGVAIVELREGVDVAAAIVELRGLPEVISVERDVQVTAFDTVPEDPLWIEQWGLRKIGAPSAWDQGTEVNDVIVAVLDTGAAIDHPDLAGNIWVAPDGTRGYNCITDNADVADNHGHGTHVAGIIGALANADGDPSNDQGVAGVAWRARLLPMKFLDEFGVGRISDAIGCFEKIAELIDGGANIRVTNNSWGGVERSSTLLLAMARLGWRGVVHVAAAGNDGRDSDLFPVFPAAFGLPNVISVGSSGISDVPSPFTNYGLASVDLAAPGEYVMSTVPTGSCAMCDPAGYAYGSGTSAAAPYVAGVAASILQSRPELRPRHVRDALLDSGSTADSSLPSSAGGRLDFARARAAVELSGATLPAFNRDPRFAAGRFRNRLLAEGDRLQIDVSAIDSDTSDEVVVDFRRSGAADLDTLAPLAWMIDRQLPRPSGSGTIELIAPSVAGHVAMKYVASAADGRGGSTRSGFVVTFAPADSDQPPVVQLVPSATSAPAGTSIVFGATAVDPDGGDVVWGYECHGAQGGFGAFQPFAVSYARAFLADGRYRCRAYAVDDELNLVVSDDVVLTIGSDGREPPTARLSVDRTVGTLPLTIQLDASASDDVDGTVQSYAFNCGNGGVEPLSTVPTATCTLRGAGPHVVRVTVVDDDLRSDSIAVPIMALLSGFQASTEAPVRTTAPSGAVGALARAVD